MKCKRFHAKKVSHSLISTRSDKIEMQSKVCITQRRTYHIQWHEVDARNQVRDHASECVSEANTRSFWNVSGLRVFQDNVFGDLEGGERQNPTGD